MLDEMILLNTYYDVYEPLLTQRQKEVFQYYYQDDLSYQEIADILKISRAGVYDILKRTRDFLHEMENKLQIVLRYDRLYHDLNELNNEAVNKILIKHKRGGSYE